MTNPMIVDVSPQTALVPAWTVAPTAPLQPGIGLDDRDEDAIKAQMLPLAYGQWLAGGWRSHGKTMSTETRRAYQRSVEDFQSFVGPKFPLWRVKGSQVIGWQNAMRERGLSETSINLRLSGLSALYAFLCDKFDFPDPRNVNRDMFLVERNPVKVATQTKIDPYTSEHADGLSQEEIRAMLHRIDRATVGGLRDYALVCSIFLTGQRSAAISRLKWGDIKHPVAESDVIEYRWASKAKEGRDELLRPAYEAILAYLAAAGRLETMRAEEFIFIALSDVATRLPNVKTVAERGPQPITGAMVNRIVKKCARRAGLDESRIHTHTLRHSAALFLSENGVDLIDIQRTLHHSNPNTTMLYLRALKRNRHPLWKSVGSFFEGM